MQFRCTDLVGVAFVVIALVTAAFAQQPAAGGTTDGAYKVGIGVSPPRGIFTPDPEYSEAARKAGYQGTVILWVIVDTEGKPREIKVARPLGMGLDEEAVNAVKRWRFKPATKDGRPVAVQINVEVNFRIDSGDGFCYRAKRLKKDDLDMLNGGKTGSADDMVRIACGFWTGQVLGESQFASYAAKAAALGSPGGAFLMGEVKRYGITQPADPGEAYMWYEIAKLRGIKDADEPLRRVMKLLTPEQRAQGEQRAQQWIAEHPAK